MTSLPLQTGQKHHSLRIASSEFDEFAGDYSQDLRKGLDLTGESPDYFAARRVNVVASLRPSAATRTILDFGCGTGGSLGEFRRSYPNATLFGFDPSEESLQVAERYHGDNRTRLIRSMRDLAEPVDLIFCNGVFHHIPPEERAESLATIRSALSPNGQFAFWENNPWNPGTRLVMSRIPFDRNAQTLTVFQAVRLLKQNGFRICKVEHHFWFPRSLGFLRFLEPWMVRIPFAGQYLILCE